MLRAAALMTAAALLAPAAKAELLHCHMLMDLASPTLGLVQARAVTALDDGCLYEGLVSDGVAGTRPALRARSLTISGDGFADLVDLAAPMRSLRLDIRELELSPEEGSGLLHWEKVLLDRDRPLDALVSYAWDELSRQVHIDALDLDFGPEGRLHLTGTLNEVDLRSADTAAISVGSMGVTALTLELTSHGIFEALLMPIFAQRLRDEYASAEAGIEVNKAAALAGIAKVPATILDASSAAALEAFVASLPTPSGQLTMALEATPGIGAPRFFGFAMTGVPRDAERFWAAFAGTTLKADWKPLPAP